MQWSGRQVHFYAGAPASECGRRSCSIGSEMRTRFPLALAASRVRARFELATSGEGACFFGAIVAATCETMQW